MFKKICVLFLLATITSCGIITKSSTTSDPTSPAVSIQPNAHALGSAAYGVNPLVIGNGATVTWTNNDSMAHTVTADDNSWNSGNIAPGSTYSRAFSSGTFSYHCAIHPSMTGKIQAN